MEKCLAFRIQPNFLNDGSASQSLKKDGPFPSSHFLNGVEDCVWYIQQPGRKAGSKHIYRKGLNSELVVMLICQLFDAAAVEIICFTGADSPNPCLEVVVNL